MKTILDVQDVPVEWTKNDWIDLIITLQKFLLRVKARNGENNEKQRHVPKQVERQSP